MDDSTIVSALIVKKPSQAPAAAAEKRLDKASGSVSAAPGQALDETAPVWQRGDKYARGVVPAPHGDMRPKQAADDGAGKLPEKPAEKKPVTLDTIVLEYRKSLRLTTHRHLFLGSLIHSWLSKQPERDQQLPRAAAIIVIQERIVAEGLAESCRPNRDLKCYWTSRLLGGDADSLVISAIRAFAKLITWDKTKNRWLIIEEHQAAARGLWARMLAESLTAEAVQAEVDKILPPPAEKKIQRQTRQMQAVLRILPILSLDELREIIRRARQEEKRAKAGPDQTAAA